jgi:CubicO group peptidase (beta-lactamase class C family)
MRSWKYRCIECDTWFRPVSARPLAGLRVGLALLLLIHLVWLSSDILALHGSRGIIPWELTDLLRDPWVPGLPTLAKAFLPLGISTHTAIILLLSSYAGSLLSLALGFHTRLAAFLAWGLHRSLMTSGSASFYGVDQLANTFLFYLFLFPSGRAWTFASRPAAADREDTIPVGCLRAMQVHLCVIYFAAGLDKAMGRQWWNGEAIWQVISQPAFSTFDLSWLAKYSLIPMLAGWGTLVVEIGYPFFICLRRTRKVWGFATIGLHLGIALCMGLVFFSSVMILLTGCLFLIPEKIPEEIQEQPAAPRQLQPLLKPLLVAICLLPLGLEAKGALGLSDDFTPLVRRLMARDQIPGLAVGLVERGRLVFARGFGYRDAYTHLPVTPDTLFALGSCSKAFTATAIALLADEGKIALDSPVRTYLPDFALEDPVATATLTTRDLLTHRSGLPRHDLFWYQAPFSRDELYRRLRFLEPAGPPHAQWRYNSLMYVVAGRIVEQVTGESWESFVQARILSSLKMRRTVLSAEEMATDSDHASPYAIHEGSVQKIPMLKQLSAIAPAGAVSSSVRDLARWLTFHATRSPGLLREDHWRDLHRPQAEMPAPDQPEVQHPYYALAWIHESYRGHPLVVHNGVIDGYTVHLGFLPETGQGLILLMNRDLATATLMALAYSAYDHLLGLEPLDWETRLVEETLPPLQDVPAVPLDFPLSKVAGRYEHPAYGPLTVRANGDQLLMQFRNFRFTLVYQGKLGFLSQEPILDGGPQISVRFSNPRLDESQKLFVPFNFDLDDPVQVFTRVR